MPTRNPIIQAVTDEVTNQKLKEIAKRDKRSVSNLAAIIIESFVEEYEKNNGEITLPAE